MACPLRPLLILITVLVLGACHGPPLSYRLGCQPNIPTSSTLPAEAETLASPTPVSVRGTPPSGRTVRLSADDLAPVDAWIDHRRNSQWVLADHVEVVANREYFAQVLTLNREGISGMVERTDDRQGDATVVTLRFVGTEYQMSAMSNPRVLIGTGLTVTARRTLTLRLMRTVDTRVPVLLRITATGQAARGRHEEVLQRADQLRLGGTLRWVAPRWEWRTFGAS